MRVWSAGCATGEEAYTLAMMLEDALPTERGWRHQVVATDMSERALAQAREGRYPAGSIHGVPAHVARWAFDAEGEDVVVTLRVRGMVRFEHGNLLTGSYPRGFDLVLCRNVLIYFDRATQQEVIERLGRSVVPGGYLALGYAERIDSTEPGLHPIRTEDGVLYRRPLPDEPARPAPPPTPEPPRTEPPPRAERAPASAPRRAPVRAGPTPPPAPVPPARLEGELDGPEGEARAREVIACVLHHAHPVIDLSALRYADDGVARLLARAASVTAAEGRPLRIIARAPGTLRFLRRHGIVPPAALSEEA